MDNVAVEQLSGQPVITELKDKTETPIDYPKEYRQRMRETLAEIERIDGANEKSLLLHNRHHSVTSSGEPILIETLAVEYLDKYQIHHKKLYVFAENIHGQIVGDRSTDIRHLEYGGEKYARAEGMTATGNRGGGIATTIERVHQDILQREAINAGIRIDWHISNRSLEELQELREDFRLDPSEELRLELEAREEEQVRWQTVYGVGGRLGFDRTGLKQFLPKDSQDKFLPPNTTNDPMLATPEDYWQDQRETVDRLKKRMKRVVGE